MSTRELIALGTSSQVPTRERSQNAYFVRWDSEGFLFDPGENAQRQLTFAGISANSIHRICISHFHGDHCLGLPGIIQRLTVDHCSHPVHLYYPESGQQYLERLCNAVIFKGEAELILHPVSSAARNLAEIERTERYVLQAHELDHSVPCLGYRIEELESLRFLPDRLEEFGIHGAMVGQLQRSGEICSQGRMVHLEEVTVFHPGSVFAFVMDTRPCSGTLALARNADLLLMEATYTSEHQNLAGAYAHSTAADAAATALKASVRQLALSHFSQRYSDTNQHCIEAREIFPNSVVLKDLDCIEIPRR